VALRPTQGYMPGIAQRLERLVPARTRGADNGQHASGCSRPIQSPYTVAKESSALLQRTHHCPNWPGAAPCAQQRADYEAMLSTSTHSRVTTALLGGPCGRQATLAGLEGAAGLQ
jgi:hypothetical protein